MRRKGRERKGEMWKRRQMGGRGREEERGAVKWHS